MNLMLQHGCVIYLQTDMNVLVQRLQNDRDDRPLLQGDDWVTKLEAIREQREKYYLQAHRTVDTEHVTLNDFKEILELCTERQ